MSQRMARSSVVSRPKEVKARGSPREARSPAPREVRSPPPREVRSPPPGQGAQERRQQGGPQPGEKPQPGAEPASRSREGKKAGAETCATVAPKPAGAEAYAMLVRGAAAACARRAQAAHL